MISTSNSSAGSVQTASAYLSQQFSGSCNISCTNVASGLTFDIINSYIEGGIWVTQSCSVDANCLISSNSDATSDVMFSANNSTNASDAGGVFSGHLFSSDSASTNSRMNIKQAIIQNTSETCKLSSLNNLNNLTILAENSTITGGIHVGQTGSTAGQCQLNNSFTAAATATGLATDSASSGKMAKGSKKGGNGNLYTIIMVIVVIVIIFIIARMFTSGQKEKSEQKAKYDVAMARAAAGCPGGGSPVLDRNTGLPIIDPATNRPICPPPKMNPNAMGNHITVEERPVINITLPSQNYGAPTVNVSANVTSSGSSKSPSAKSSPQIIATSTTARAASPSKTGSPTRGTPQAAPIPITPKPVSAKSATPQYTFTKAKKSCLRL